MAAKRICCRLRLHADCRNPYVGASAPACTVAGLQPPWSLHTCKCGCHWLQATNVVAGEGKGIVDSTIYLRVYTDALPDLTLTDLPGIT